MASAHGAGFRGHVLVARLDNVGDVLLAGPAVRALGSRATRVSFLAGPRGADAAALLPGVDDVFCYDAPWVADPAPPVDAEGFVALVRELARRRIDAAVIFTSFHQSALPLALTLRLAGIGPVAALSTDYPGSLLDVRIPEPAAELHEAERALYVAAGCGAHLPEGDDGRLRIRDSGPLPLGLPDHYVVVHPGASQRARTAAPERFARIVEHLARAGHAVVITGGAEEKALAEEVGEASPGAVVLAGQCSLSGLAAVLAGADVVVVGNTGPAHLAAAVGTPVVSLFAPTVPATRWRPYGVPHVLLGDQEIACARCRARRCPLGDDQPCLRGVDGRRVVSGIEQLMGLARERASRV